MNSPIVPIPRCPVAVRAATADDLPFIDGLQKRHARMVGWMPTQQIEGKIAAGHVIVAEQDAVPVGYCIGHDQYFKRDDVGIIYQMNVAPGRQRGFVGATLLKAMFERAAYGCRLFCCWCAQDIEANRFWESMGFVALAYRAGSEKKSRVHVFWQKRIRAGDTTTPWWFPAKTDAGAMREDRIVLPIPPGRHWSDELPVLGPQATATAARALLPDKTRNKKLVPGTRCGPQKPTPRPRARVQFGPPGAQPAAVVVVVEDVTPEKKPAKPKRQKVKADPKLVAAARELRDRWLERVNTAGLLAGGKYDVSRALDAPPAAGRTVPVLPAPAVPAAA